MASAENRDTMPVKAFRSLLRVVANHGYQVTDVLSDLGLEDYNLLNASPVDIDNVPTRVYSRLYRHLMILLQDEAFGMMTPNRAPPGTFRMMCLFILGCKTLRQGIIRNAEFLDYCDQFRSAGNRRIPLTEDHESGRCLIRFNPPNSEEANDGHASKASTLYMMWRLFSWFTGHPLTPLEVHFVSTDERLCQEYETLFGASVRTDMDDYALVLPINLLDIPLVQTESTLQSFLRSAPYPLISRSDPHDNDAWQEKVKAIFARHPGSEVPSAQRIAEHLNMSVRTLHRHLQKEGTSYQTLKDEFRKETALAYMKRRELKINTIALLMGFQDSSAFHRSFKKWTGQSPGQYRRQLDSQT
ncbi:AraC-like DNA-binding protein [Litorivivens lipolytica]|uniref:AraC-like DNA-binding protein n=1 Tax=Litorivivens lipolytica TaxID=1524264 RepID=A0A7W4W433_9GAMM|nr:AraC family transcriptional regulator [Litorivivens lipolytica]MBB3046499.1 AraC-like DNA-binding protein [Litorivivens lipolytica]